MPPRYANDTDVTVDRSRAEIEKTLQRYGAESFVFGIEPGRALVMFRMGGRHFRFLLTLPESNDREFTRTAQGRERTSQAAREAWEQACRSRWRALLLIIKAKLEAIASGITTLETEFLPYTMLPSGMTAAEWLEPQVEQAYRTGEMPRALPGFQAPALGSGQ